MAKIEVFHRNFLNSKEVPERLPGESEESFQGRVECFRSTDKRIPVAGLGKFNFSFPHSFIIGNGVLGLRDWQVMRKMVDGVETDDYRFSRNAGGSWSTKTE